MKILSKNACLSRGQRTRLWLAGTRAWRKLGCLTYLAAILKSRQRFQEASILYRRVLSSYQECLGPAHPRTLASERSYSLMLEEMGVSQIRQFQPQASPRRCATPGIRRGYTCLITTSSSVSPSPLNKQLKWPGNAVIDRFVYFEGSGDDAFSSQQFRAESVCRGHLFS